MLAVRENLQPKDLLGKIAGLWELSAKKIRMLQGRESSHTPVFTVKGKYASRSWTEWTLGFHHGSALLQFDATGEAEYLQTGRTGTMSRMVPHVTHSGVHDHGFTIVSTFGNLWRLMRENKTPQDPWELRTYELALAASGAVQAMRWTATRDGGFIHSFRGPHSLFADTIRTLRSLALAHRLGQVLLAENDQTVSLLERLVQHGLSTARYSVYYGEGRDIYDVPGRVAHESVFHGGRWLCPATQQGYSPFSTWTRGLAWVMLGFAEELEFLQAAGLPAPAEFARAARATSEYYLQHAAADGIPYWDTGAPGLPRLDLGKPADPWNEFEPVDSSAASIAAQGLVRLGRHLGEARYLQAGLTILDALFDEPYLSRSDEHEGLILHSVYHRPSGWDEIPRGSRIPRGESSMWGDYHAREAALLVGRLARSDPYHTFFGPP